MPEYYEIIIKGQFDPRWSNWFEDMTVTHPAENETLLAGLLPDQAALHGLFERIRDLNITLVSVTCGGALPQSPNPDRQDAPSGAES